MTEPNIAFVANLLADPSRAAMCLSLTGGEARPAGELAAAGIEAVNGAGKMQKVALTMLAAGNEPIDQPVG